MFFPHFVGDFCTIAVIPDTTDWGSRLLKQLPDHLANAGRDAQGHSSARRIRGRVVSAIDLSSQTTSWSFLYLSPDRLAQADARNRESGNRSAFLPCHWRWCRRRFVHRPLTWRRSVVDVAHRAALSKSGKSQRSGARSNGASATIRSPFEWRVRISKLYGVGPVIIRLESVARLSRWAITVDA